MISLKRYLDSAETQLDKPEKDSAQSVSFALLSAYRSALAEIGECSANACPDLVSELKRQLTRLDEDLGDHPGVPASGDDEQVHELLKGWGNRPIVVLPALAG